MGSRLTSTVAIVLCSCGGTSTTGNGATVQDDASVSIIVLPVDAGFRLLNFECDGRPPDDVASESLGDEYAAAVGCVVRNPNVRFQTNVLPTLAGCSGELCHAPWSYSTTVRVLATECCDQRRLIDPGRPEQSYLLQKIRGIDLCGESTKMGDVAENVVRDIEDWICLGAPDN